MSEDSRAGSDVNTKRPMEVLVELIDKGFAEAGERINFEGPPCNVFINEVGKAAQLAINDGLAAEFTVALASCSMANAHIYHPGDPDYVLHLPSRPGGK